MSKAEYALLQDVIMDADFPDLDLALRRGRHVDREDAAWYSLLTDAQELLEPFYRRYGCELIHKTDGYFYLLPTGDKVSRKQLAATDMLVGQALALLYLDPAAVERGGVVTQEEVVSQLSAVLGSDALIGVFSPGKRKAKDERIAQRNVRQRVGEAMRRLAVLGFVELSDENAVRLRAALLRFAEPVRGLSEPAEALAKLVAQGEVALAPDEPSEDSEGAEEEPDRTTLVGVPSPVVDFAGSGFDAADGGGESEAVAGQPRRGETHADDGREPSGGDAALVSHESESGGTRGNADAAGTDEAERPLRSVGSSAARTSELASGADAEFASHADAELARADGEVGRGVDDASGDALAEVDVEDIRVRAELDAAELDEEHAEDGMADTLAGIGAPSVEGDGLADAADGGVQERSAVVRKPRAPVTDEDLDWADILVPEPDAEDGA